MDYEVPATLQEFDLTMGDDAVIRVRRHGNVDASVRLFLSHGNGFAIDGYLPFWEQLADHFDLIVFDARNHGRNPPSDPANHHYEQMARDMESIFQGVTARLGTRSSVGVFHSMSARAAMKHAVEIAWVWDALVLFDPPNVPLQGHRLYDAMCAFEKRLVAWAKARGDRFADPAGLAAEYAGTRSHGGWVVGTHALMARAVLHLDKADGNWVLTCPRALEAAIYEAALTLDLWPQANDFGGPVKLVGADPEVDGAPPTGKANAALAEENGYAYESIPGTGHMLQIEKPAECVRALTDFLIECGVGGD